MATKTYRQDSATQPVPDLISRSYGAYFGVGDTAYYTNANGLQVPVIVVAVRLGGAKTSDGNHVLYTVVGDISGATNILGGGAQGPIKGVIASQLSSR